MDRQPADPCGTDPQALQGQLAAVTKERDILRALIDSLPENIFIKDRQSCFLAVNKAEMANNGADSAVEVVGKTDFDFYPPEEASQYFADEQEVLRTGKPLAGHEELQHDAAGNTRWMLTTKAPLLDEDGQIVGLAGISRDITDRKLAEEALRDAKGQLEVRVAERTAELAKAYQELRESELWFRSVAQTASEGIIMIDAEGHVIFWNPAAEAMFGYSAEAMADRPLTCIMPERFRTPHRSAMAELVATGRTHVIGETIQLFGLRRDGDEFPIEVSLSTWSTEKGRFFSGIIRDITKQKCAEDELRRLAGQLRNLAQAASDLNARLEVTAVGRALAAAGMRMANTAAGMAGVMVGHQMVFTEYSSGDTTRPVDYTFGPGEGVPGWVIHTCQPYVCNDVKADSQVLPEIQKALGLYNLVNVPLLGRGGTLLGCLELHNSRDRREFNEQDVEMLQTLADLGASAMENAQRLAMRVNDSPNDETS